MLTGSLQLSVYITRLICKAAHLLYGIRNQDCSGTINTRLKQQILSLFFFFCSRFPSFSYKMVQTTIKNICAVDNLQKKSFDSITVQFFFFRFFCSVFSLFPLETMRVWYTRIPFSGLQPRSCGLRHIFKMVNGYCNRTHLSVIKKDMQKAPIVQLQFA